MKNSLDPINVFGNTKLNEWEQTSPRSISMATSDASWIISHEEGYRHTIKRYTRDLRPLHEMACAPSTEMAKELVNRIINRDDGGGFETLVEEYGWRFIDNPYSDLKSIYLPITTTGVKSHKGNLIAHIRASGSITFGYEGVNSSYSWPILSGWTYDEFLPPEDGGTYYWEDDIDIKAIVMKMAYENVIDYCRNTRFHRHYKSD